MAIIGAILAQGAIRHLDRQKREQRADDQSNCITEQHKGFSLENSANGM
jgi:type II secretory pathway pseudopilin PulG